MGSRLATGIVLVTIVLLLNTVIAFIQTDTAGSATQLAGCTQTGNATSNSSFVQCQNTSKTSFINSLFGVTTKGIDGMPDMFNGLYVLITGAMLIGGIILIIVSLIPFLGF